MATLDVTSRPQLDQLTTLPTITLITPYETSLSREVVLGDDPLMFFPFDPGTFDSNSSLIPMWNIARLDEDDPRFFDDSFSNYMYKEVGTFTFPSNASEGLEFDGQSCMSKSLNRDAAPGSFSGGTATTQARVLQGEKKVSIEVWMKHPAASNTGITDVVCIGGGLGSNDNGIRIRMDENADTIGVRFEDTTLAVHEALATSIVLDDDTWHHVVATWDGVDLKMYIDGVLEATTTPPADTEILWPTTTSTSKNDSGFIVKLGASIRSFTSTSAFFEYEGFLNNLAVYAYGLTAAQVLAHYNANNFSLYVPASGFKYARAEFPPNPEGDVYDVLGRATTTETRAAVGGWKDAGATSIVGDADNLSLTVRIPKDPSQSFNDRKVDFLTEVVNGAGDSLIQFGLSYDPRMTSSSNKAVKFVVHNGLTAADALYSTEVGGFPSGPAIDGMWDFEWEIGTFYRFDLVDTGTGIALYLNDALVKEFIVTPSGFDVENMVVRSEDWQHYLDPVVLHDWLVFRADQGATEFTLTEVTTDLDNEDWYESLTRDAVRISDYIVRHRLHDQDGQADSSGDYSFTLYDEAFNRRPTLGNSPGVEWIPVTNTIDES